MLTQKEIYSEESEKALWQQTVEVLLIKGHTLNAAMDGANRAVQAYRHSSRPPEPPPSSDPPTLPRRS